MTFGPVNAAVIKDERSLERIQFNHHHFQIPVDTDAIQSSFRSKRALIFRPLFVYKQQEIRRKKLKEERKGRKQQMIG